MAETLGTWYVSEYGFLAHWVRRERDEEEENFPAAVCGKRFARVNLFPPPEGTQRCERCALMCARAEARAAKATP